MTREEHETKSRTLKAKVTRLNNKAKRQQLLADKVALQRQAKQVQEVLLQHKLNYYSIVSNP